MSNDINASAARFFDSKRYQQYLESSNKYKTGQQEGIPFKEPSESSGVDTSIFCSNPFGTNTSDVVSKCDAIDAKQIYPRYTNMVEGYEDPNLPTKVFTA